MQDRPSAIELLQAVRSFIQDQAIPQLEGRAAFHGRVAVNALSIVERGLELGPAQDAAELERLEALLGRTGSLDELKKLTTSLGIFFAKQTSNNANYSVDHSAAVLVVNPAGEFHALFSGTHQIDNFVQDMPLIMGNY